MQFKVMPSARVKRIYVLLEAKNRTEVESTIFEYLGILGWAKVSPVFVEGGKREGRIILSIDRREVSNIRAAFEGSPTKIKMLKVSGTIKGLTKQDTR